MKEKTKRGNNLKTEEEQSMKKIILTTILAGSAAFAFAGNFSLNLGGIGVSVGEGRNGTNVGVSIGSPYYCYPPVVVTPPPPPVWIPPVYYPARPAYRPAPPPPPRKPRHDGPPRGGRPGGPGKPGPRR